MVTVKFSIEKADKQFIITPFVAADYEDVSKKATLGLFFGWLNIMLNVSIHWTRKNGTAYSASSGIKI